MGVALELGGRHPLEPGLALERRLARGEAGAIGDAEDVRVDGDG